MNVEIKPGKYVVAISGGVDSMVLLDILRRESELELIVTHFNHGTRSDSTEDEKLVVKTAKANNIPFEVGYAKLGKNASEERARKLRYEFLNNVKKHYSADSIITAHHQDDLIETAFINILRGSGPRGLISMSSNPGVQRPLLDKTKEDLINYAKKNNLKWREDSTNQDLDYLRNYIRLDNAKRKNLLKEIQHVADNSLEKEQIIATMSQKIVKNGEISRNMYMSMPLEIRRELITYWLRKNGILDYDKKTVERLDLALKTGVAGTKYEVKSRLWLIVDKKTGHFTSHS
jgi:tRNA(Ile)-lysidine synthase